MNRRNFIAGVGVVSASTLAGCGGMDSESANGESTTSIELSNSDLETSNGETRGTFELTNEGEEEEIAQLTTKLRIGTNGVYGTYTNELTVTVPAGETTTKDLLIVNRSSISEVANTELNDGYFELEYFLDGESVLNQDIGNQPSQHISFRILYNGAWQGAVGGEESIRNIQADGNAHLAVDNDSFIVSGNAQKNDDSGQEIIVQIIVNGDVTAEAATTAAFGVAQVSTESSESPIDNPRVPYEPEEVHLGGEVTGEDTTGETGATEAPNKEEAISVIEQYFTAYNERDTDRLNELSHPDSLEQEFTEEELEELGEFTVILESIETVSIDEEEQIAVFRLSYTFETEQGDDSYENLWELRVYQGEWRIWHE